MRADATLSVAVCAWGPGPMDLGSPQHAAIAATAVAGAIVFGCRASCTDLGTSATPPSDGEDGGGGGAPRELSSSTSHANAAAHVKDDPDMDIDFGALTSLEPSGEGSSGGSPAWSTTGDTPEGWEGWESVMQRAGGGVNVGGGVGGGTLTPGSEDGAAASPRAEPSRPRAESGGSTFSLQMAGDEYAELPLGMLPSPMPGTVDMPLMPPAASLDGPGPGARKRVRESGGSPRWPGDGGGGAQPMGGSAGPSGGGGAGGGGQSVDISKIPLQMLAEQPLPPELASMLLHDESFEPGPKPVRFDPSAGKFLFKERVGFVKAAAADPAAAAAAQADRWHNSGGVQGSRDMPKGGALPPPPLCVCRAVIFHTGSCSAPCLCVCVRACVCASAAAKPLVRRRYGSIVQHPNRSKDFRYHEYTLVRTTVGPDGRSVLVEEDRSVILFHVMISRKAKGRPSKAEAEAPARMWASLGIGACLPAWASQQHSDSGPTLPSQVPAQHNLPFPCVCLFASLPPSLSHTGLQQSGSSVVPTHGPPIQPNVTRSPASAPAPRPPGSSSAAAAAVGAGASAVPWFRVNGNAASVRAGHAMLNLCGPPAAKMSGGGGAVSFAAFHTGQAPVGQIAAERGGCGAFIESPATNFCHWHLRAASEPPFNGGEVVGIFANGTVCRRTGGATMVGVISRRAIAKGGMPPHEAAKQNYDTVAYAGTARVCVRGLVKCGDLLVPSGAGDGIAAAAGGAMAAGGGQWIAPAGGGQWPVGVALGSSGRKPAAGGRQGVQLVEMSVLGPSAGPAIAHAMAVVIGAGGDGGGGGGGADGQDSEAQRRLSTVEARLHELETQLQEFGSFS
eukprot:SAG22_NODE_153_length_17315_cov_69.981935_1_plen_844_part_00